MTVRSLSNGHVIYYDEREKVWRYEKDNAIVNNEIACHKCGKEPKLVDILGGKKAGVDECIAPIVDALNYNGIQTEAACCGHGRMPGTVILSDGRWLGVFENQEHYNKYVTEKITHTIYGEEMPIKHD